MKERCKAPSMRLEKSGKDMSLTFGKADPDLAVVLQMADMGTTDRDFHIGLLGHVLSVGARNKDMDEISAIFLVSVIRSIQPRDELEAMLATQMGAIHAATMMMARKLNHVSTIPQQDSAERALNKLVRTFATQMEALKRYRSTGQQKVTVEHVTVNAGGQAIVGAVATGGGPRGEG